MRQLLVVALAVTSGCAARNSLVAPAAPTSRAPAVTMVQAEPSTEIAAPVTDDAADENTTTSDAMVDADASVAPYALVFHEGQKWTFDVSSSVAMTDSQHTHSVDCHVASVEYMCDRKVARVECDSEPVNAVVGGIYTSTGRGMWRTALNAAPGEGEQLDDKARVFARFPESLVDGTGKPLAQPFDGGWCASANGSTLCVSADRGITGGSVATAKGTLRIGAAPARVAIN
jgi:hypothetical protein